ncbi:hypothetical protein Vadar_005112 [Vaccinium darrowii]|nr:hypothetical protein Vadar_005112 [Vaccinium darrowii]
MELLRPAVNPETPWVLGDNGRFILGNGSESVYVHIEYQWIPPKCPKCKVFGHACKPKAETPIGNDETWQQIGKALGGGGGTLEALTKVVPNATGYAFTIQPDKERVLIEEDSPSEASEDMEEPVHPPPTCSETTDGSSCSNPPTKENNEEKEPITPKPVGQIGDISQARTQQSGMSCRDAHGNIPPDPPDDHNTCKSDKEHNKARNKKAGSGSKGGVSHTPKKGRSSNKDRNMTFVTLISHLGSFFVGSGRLHYHMAEVAPTGPCMQMRE